MSCDPAGPLLFEIRVRPVSFGAIVIRAIGIRDESGKHSKAQLLADGSWSLLSHNRHPTSQEVDSHE